MTDTFHDPDLLPALAGIGVWLTVAFAVTVAVYRWGSDFATRDAMPLMIGVAWPLLTLAAPLIVFVLAFDALARNVARKVARR